MKLTSHKKGFTYMIAVSLLVAIVIIVFLSVNDYSYFDQQELYKTRILTVNDFVSDFNTDVHRATYITSFRTLLSLEDYIVQSSGEFFNDTETVFKETFYFGTINGTEVSLMNDSSFEDYITKINTMAHGVDLTSAINITNITLSHMDPWNLEVAVHATVNITDKRGVASWHFKDVYITKVPIYDLRDPLYSTFTDNKVPHTIREFDGDLLVNGTNTTELQRFINQSYYLATPKAPSFLQRFENNWSAHPYGIESIVDVNDLSAQEIPVYQDRIKVDYIYFNDLGGTKLCDVQGMPAGNYFVITLDRNVTYNVSGLTYKNGTDCP